MVIKLKTFVSTDLLDRRHYLNLVLYNLKRKLFRLVSVYANPNASEAATVAT